MQIYDAITTDFKCNGITINPTTAKLTCENINAMPIMEAEFDNESRNIEYIEENKIIKFKGIKGIAEEYRIISIEKGDYDTTITAIPLFYADKTIAKDYTNNDITMVRCVDMTGQQALDKILLNTPYIGHSNILNTSTLYLDSTNVVQAINGDADNTFINRWGGEIEVINQDVYINERIGTDKGYRITYGKNLESIKESVDISGVITRLIPYNSQNIKLGNATPWEDSPYIDNYPQPYEEKILLEHLKLKDEEENYDEDDIVFDTIAELRDAMREECKRIFREEQIDRPVVTIELSMVDLASTIEYKQAGYSKLEKLLHGDTVYCKHSKLGVETTTRMVGYVWDIMTKEYESLTLGSVEKSVIDINREIANKVNNVTDNNGNLLAEKVRGEINAINTSIIAQRDTLEQSHVRGQYYVDNVEGSPTYGYTAIGTKGIETSNKKDINGNWIPQTVITPQGVVCDTLYGNYIKSQNGQSVFNMNNGVFDFGDTARLEPNMLWLWMPERARKETDCWFLNSNGLTRRTPNDMWSISWFNMDYAITVSAGGSTKIQLPKDYKYVQHFYVDINISSTYCSKPYQALFENGISWEINSTTGVITIQSYLQFYTSDGQWIKNGYQYLDVHVSGTGCWGDPNI